MLVQARCVGEGEVAGCGKVLVEAFIGNDAGLGKLYIPLQILMST
jgi:hypothetical protein